MAYLVGPSLGQPQQQPADSGVRKAANTTTNGNGNGNATASGPKAPVPPIIGTVDLDVIFKNYKKVEASNKEFHGAMMLRRAELQKIDSEARQEAEVMKTLAPGTDDYRKRENHLTELKAKMDAGREQAEREFSLRQAETMGTLYKEVQAMVARVAKWRGMTYVVKVTSRPITGSDPNSVMAAISETMVYADPRNDITNDVVHYLNHFYQATASPTPRAETRTPSAGAAPAPGAAQPGGEN